MNASFRKNIFISLTVLVFSLLTSAYIVFAQGLDLVSRWNGDVVSGTTASDVAGGNNGAILGGVTVVPGQVGKVFKFDGSSGRINMGNPASLNFGTTNPFSLEAWFNWDGGGESSSINIIRKSNYPVSDPGAGYWLRIGRDTRVLEFFTGETVGYGNPPSGRVTTPIDPNTWYHVVATRDGVGTMKLYVNDELRGTTQAAGAETTSEAPFLIGAWDDRFGVTELFSGLIGEVLVYTKALDSSEVKSAEVDDPDKVKELADIEKKLEPFIKNKQSPGQCRSFDECQAYCNIEENFSECAEFEKKADIVQTVPPEQQAVFNAIQKGESPGGCKDEATCRTYCEEMDHLNECISFIEKFNLVTPDELKEMRQMAEAKQGGVPFPGNCQGRENCLAYCENSAHAVECMEFAQKAGLLKGEDVEAVSKILPYLKSGGKLPGGCATKESCDAYCESDTHANECVDFAVGAGFMTKEEADIVKKVGGKGPGNCKSREACDNYCKNEEHTDECVDFAVRAGLVSKEDADMAKKFKITSGPGGCKSKADCQSFCTLPANQEACMSWAKEHGMDTGGPGGGAGFSGPGGCKNKEECTAYCTANQKDEACKKMIQDDGGGERAGGSPGGPGGCKSQEECASYCKDHQQECQKFAPPGGGGNGTGGSDESQVPRGYSSWEEFCKAQPGDSRCTAYQPQTSPSGGGVDTRSSGSAGGGPVSPSSFPQTSPSSNQIPQDYCSSFASVPSCDYVGLPGSQNYKYCKQCFPDK